MMKRKFFTAILMCSALAFISCSKEDGTESELAQVIPPGDQTSGDSDSGKPASDNPTLPIDILPVEGFENLTEAVLDDYTSDVAVRLLFMLYDPNAEYNDIDLIDRYLKGLAYVQALEATRSATRGVWGQAKAMYDFGAVLKDANVLHRTTLIGAMAKWDYSDKAAREEIWGDIRDYDCLPSKYKSYSADEFWKEFSTGKLDSYAPDVYNAVMAQAGKMGAGKNKTGDLAATMAYNNLRHIDLTLAVAPKLVEAGANIVFAFGDDLISNGKLAYDFVNTNGEVVFKAAQGNLTPEAFMDACNNNLKLLTKGLKETIPTTQDLTELLSDLTTEQIKALNKEIDDAIKRAGDQQISKDEIALFVENASEILKPSIWTMNFADIEYEAKDGSTFEIQSEQGGSETKTAYKFVYCDKFENVLLEAKCSVKKKYITIRVDYLDERCDLLPAGASLGDIFPIPYLGGTGETAPESIYLWWESNLHSFKSFSIKHEKPFAYLLFSCDLSTSDERNFASKSYKKELYFTTDEMVVSKQKDTYSVTAEKQIDDLNYTVKIKFSDEGINDMTQLEKSNIVSLEYYHLTLGDSDTKTWTWTDASFTLSNLKFKGYVDHSKTANGTDNDKFVLWEGLGGYNYTGFTMNEFTGYLVEGKAGSSTKYLFHDDNTGKVKIQIFYQCEDIEKYKDI